MDVLLKMNASCVDGCRSAVEFGDRTSEDSCELFPVHGCVCCSRRSTPPARVIGIDVVAVVKVPLQ